MKVQTYLRQIVKSGKTPEQALEILSSKFDIKTTFSPIREPLVILNYDQIKSKKSNPIVGECRGLVLDYHDNFRVVARAFNRFFNYGELPTVTRRFDWTEFSCLEKVDGSLVIIYFYNGTWRVNTRGSFANSELPGSGMTWEAFIWSLLEEQEFGAADERCSYVYELCSLYNKVVVHHEEPKVIFLAKINNETGEECQNSPIIGTFNVPKRYSFHSLDDLLYFLEHSQDLNATDEGVVVKDKNGMRLKLKRQSYLRLHRLRGESDNLNRLDTIYELVLTGEQDEVLTHWPEYTPKFEEAKKKILEEIFQLEFFYQKYNNYQSQKDFANYVMKINSKLKWILFECRKHKLNVRDIFYGENYLSKIVKGLMES